MNTVNNNGNGEVQTISKYNRLRGGLQDVALFTRPSAIKNVQNITGQTETWVVETCRHEDQGDYIFLECVDETGVTRLPIPPKVADAIAAQRESLTKRRRSQAGKKRAQEMKDRGGLPGLMRKKVAAK